MHDELEQRLTRLGGHYGRSVASITTHEVKSAASADPPVMVDSEPRTAVLASPRRGRGPRRVALAAAAATLLVGVAAIAWVVQRQSLERAAEEPPSPSVAVSLFPAGGLGDVTAAIYLDPDAVARAYIKDRMRPGQLPAGGEAQARVSGDPTYLGPNQAILPFTLHVGRDTTDGLLLARGTIGPYGDRHWYVVAAATKGLTTEMTLEDELLALTCSGGITQITVRNAFDSSIVASAAARPLVEGTGAETSAEVLLPGAATVSVQFWSAGDSSDRLPPQFAEQLISPGQNRLVGGWDVLVELRSIATD